MLTNSPPTHPLQGTGPPVGSGQQVRGTACDGWHIQLWAHGPHCCDSGIRCHCPCSRWYSARHPYTARNRAGCTVVLFVMWSPVSFRLGCTPSRGQCALVLCRLPWAGRAPLQAGPVLFHPGCRDIYPLSLPNCSSEAPGQCKLGLFPTLARLLLLHSQQCQRLFRASCAGQLSSLPPRGCSHGPGPTDGRIHLQK